MSIQANQTAAQVFDRVLRAEDNHCLRAQLEREFKDIAPLDISDAVATLIHDRVLIEDGDTLRVPIAQEEALAVEPLAAVVNHVLLSSASPLTVEQVCVEVERDPTVVNEHREVLLALVLVAYCGLAQRHDDGRWSATRAAVWAERLSF